MGQGWVCMEGHCFPLGYPHSCAYTNIPHTHPKFSYLGCHGNLYSQVPSRMTFSRLHHVALHYTHQAGLTWTKEQSRARGRVMGRVSGGRLQIISERMKLPWSPSGHCTGCGYQEEPGSGAQLLAVHRCCLESLCFLLPKPNLT